MRRQLSAELNERWSLGTGGAGWLTAAVQVGFVIGSITSAWLTLADRLEARLLMAFCSLAASVSTALLVVASGPVSALGLRFLTGLALAGVYAPGLKLAASYFARRRGFALGVVIGGLALGSGSPHLLKAVSTPSADGLLLATAGAGLLAACLSAVVGTVRLLPRSSLSIRASSTQRFATGHSGSQPPAI